MGIIVRQSIITTILSYFGVLIGYINLLYLYPRFLTTDQIGVMRTVQDAAILMAQFAQFGLAQSIIKFFPRFAGEPDKGKNFINLILVSSLLTFSVFLVIFFVFENVILAYFIDNARDFVHYVSLVLWMTLITVITTMIEVYSRSLLKTVLPNFLKEIATRVLLSVLVLCYFMNIINFAEVMVLSILIYVFCLIILIFSLALQGNLQWKVRFTMDAPLRKELVRFSLMSFAGTAGLIIIGKVDSLMVAGLLGLAPVAIYTTSYYMATVIEIPKRAMTQIASPLISRGFEKNEPEEIKKIYSKTALNQFIPGLLLLIGIIANLDSIFLMMPKGEIYQAGKWVVVIVGTGKLIDMLFGPSSEIIVYSKYYAFNIILIIILAFVIITANNLLIPVYGINGAAWGAAITLVIFNAVKFIFIWARMKLQPFSSAFLKVAAIGMVTYLLNSIIPRLDMVILDMVVRSAIITMVFGSLILWTKVSPESNNLVARGLSILGFKKS